MEKRLIERDLDRSFLSSKEASNPDIGLSGNFFLIQDGLVIGPFLCLGRTEHLEALLHSHQIRIVREGA